jgi:glutathione S-transferase
MADILLHHYTTSPYSEKIRAILGYKRMAWRSVFIPAVMPKPDLVALTGGYRRTPVLQIGCDVYCDSKLIARVLDRLQPEPALVPAGMEATCAMVEQWSEQYFFLLVVPIVLQPAGLAHFFGKAPPAAIQHFQKDREALFGSGNGRRASMGATRNELPAALAALEAQLTSCPYVHGVTPTLSDFSLFHPLWFILSNPGVSAYLDGYPNLLAWARRISALGHGEFERASAMDALQVARDSRPRPNGPHIDDPAGLKPGDRVRVGAADYGTEAVDGELVFTGLDEIALKRRDERAGEVVVHFPRQGFRIDRA